MPEGILNRFAPGTGPRWRQPLAYPTPPVIYRVDPNTSRTPGTGTVTIYGDHFLLTGGTGTLPVVRFGGVIAQSVVLVDSRTLTCSVPAVPDPGIVDITVSVGGIVATGEDIFTYYESVITSITPEYGPISGGTPVVIVGYNFIDGTLVYFDLNLATDIVVVDSQMITCKTPAHALGFISVLLVEPL